MLGPKSGACVHAHEDAGEAQECLDREAVLTNGGSDRGMRTILSPREARLFAVDTGPGRLPYDDEVV